MKLLRKDGEAFASKYRPGDADPAGGKVTRLAIEAAKNGYTLFNVIVMNKKSAINNFMSANYSNAKHGSVFLWGKPHFSESEREHNYKLFLQIYMKKGDDGRWERNQSMWNRNEKGEYTSPKKQ